MKNNKPKKRLQELAGIPKNNLLIEQPDTDGGCSSILVIGCDDIKIIVDELGYTLEDAMSYVIGLDTTSWSWMTNIPWSQATEQGASANVTVGHHPCAKLNDMTLDNADVGSVISQTNPSGDPVIMIAINAAGFNVADTYEEENGYVNFEIYAEDYTQVSEWCPNLNDNDDDDDDDDDSADCEQFNTIVDEGTSAEEICGTPGGGIIGSYYDMLDNPSNYPLPLIDQISQITNDGACCPGIEGDCNNLNQLTPEQQTAICNAYLIQPDNPGFIEYNPEECCPESPPEAKYSCFTQNFSDGECVEDPNGPYDSLGECQDGGCEDPTDIDCKSETSSNVYNVFGGFENFCSNACGESESTSPLCECCPLEPEGCPDSYYALDEYMQLQCCHYIQEGIGFGQMANLLYNPMLEKTCAGVILDCCDELEIDDVFSCNDVDVELYAQETYNIDTYAFCTKCKTGSFTDQECECCPEIRYSCPDVGSNNSGCIENENGPYTSMDECMIGLMNGECPQGQPEKDPSRNFIKSTPLLQKLNTSPSLKERLQKLAGLKNIK